MSSGRTIASLFFIAVIVFGIGLLVLTVQKLEKKITFQSSAANESNLCPVSTSPKLFTKNENIKKQLLQKKSASLTNEFYKSLKDNNKSDQLALIKKRKAYLLETMNSDPKSALKAVIPQNKRNMLASVVKDCVENQVTLSGKLAIKHIDYLKPTSNDTMFFLLTSDTNRIQMHLTDPNKFQHKSGDTIQVTGYQLDQHLLVNTNDKKSVISMKQKDHAFFEKALADTPDTIGTQRTLVVLFNFQNKSLDSSVTIPEVQDLVFNKTSRYYQEVSYGKTTLIGDVIGPVTIPLDQTCDTDTPDSALITAIDPLVNFTSYDRLLFIGPFGPGCDYAGYSYIGKIPLTTQDGAVNLSESNIIDTYVTSPNGNSLVEHEMGHGLGLDHANFLYCGNATFDTSDINNPCGYIEYGDHYDVMGNWSFGHFNAPHKKALGWFNPDNITTVTSDGTYTLEPIETATDNLKAIQIQREPAFGGDDYYTDYLTVEYRQAIGYDSYFQSMYNDNVLNGALLHIGDSYYPYLIDPSPPGQENTAALQVGQSVTDPMTGSQITVKSKLPTALTLDVKVGKTDFIPPTISITSPASGVVVSGTITLSSVAQDASGIEKVAYTAGALGQVIATSTTPPYTASIDTTKMPNGIEYIDAIAYDKSGEAYGALGNTGSDEIYVDVENSDTIPPSVAITNPSEGSGVTNPVQVSAVASDNVGIDRVEYYIDNDSNLYDSETTPPYSIPVEFLPYYQIAPGPHTIYAKVYDYAGNVTTSPSINFTVIADTISPSVQIVSPVNNSQVSGIIPIKADATDNSGAVESVSFSLSQNSLAPINVGTLYSPPFEGFMDTTSLANNSSFDLYAIATDISGNSTTSSPVHVTVVNPTPSVSPPISGPQPTLTLRFGDANGDGVVNIADVLTVLSNWLQNLTNSVDQYGDGRINALDFVRVTKYLQ